MEDSTNFNELSTEKQITLIASVVFIAAMIMSVLVAML